MKSIGIRRSFARTSRQELGATTADAAAVGAGTFLCPDVSNAFSGTEALSLTKPEAPCPEKGSAPIRGKAWVPAESRRPGARRGPFAYEANALLSELRRPAEDFLLAEPANDVKLSPDDVERFWSHVDKNGPVSEVLGTRCWLWTGGKTNRGYGQFMVGSRPSRVNVPAHAVSLVIHGVVVPPGHERRHLCGIRPCVNPEHVKPGTHRENMNDHYPHNAAMTFEEAEQLRKEYRETTVKGGKSRVCERWATAKGITFRCAQYAAMGATYKMPHLQPKRQRHLPAPHPGAQRGAK